MVRIIRINLTFLSSMHISRDLSCQLLDFVQNLIKKIITRKLLPNTEKLFRYSVKMYWLYRKTFFFGNTEKLFRYLVLHKFPKKFFGIHFCINYQKVFSVFSNNLLVIKNI
jgi:hypothetical protein